MYLGICILLCMLPVLSFLWTIEPEKSSKQRYYEFRKEESYFRVVEHHLQIKNYEHLKNTVVSMSDEEAIEHFKQTKPVFSKPLPDGCVSAFTFVKKSYRIHPSRINEFDNVGYNYIKDLVDEALYMFGRKNPQCVVKSRTVFDKQKVFIYNLEGGPDISSLVVGDTLYPFSMVFYACIQMWTEPIKEGMAAL